jgi:hypothetical protein
MNTQSPMSLGVNYRKTEIPGLSRIFVRPYQQVAIAKLFYHAPFENLRVRDSFEFRVQNDGRRGSRSVRGSFAIASIGVETENRTSVLEAHFQCPRETMLLVNYENPKGEKNHQSLWNGGYASGFLRLYLKKNGTRVPVADLTGELGGCEYGEY